MRLTDTEKRIARATFDAMFPSDPEARVRTGIGDGDIEGFLDDLCESWEPLPVLTLRVGFVMVALAAVFIARSFTPFDELPRERRLAVLERLYSSDQYFVRQLITMQKATAGFLYGAMIRPQIAPGRAPEVDHGLIEWRKLVPAGRDPHASAAHAAPEGAPQEAA
jgi:hypothetical protein